ncbi:hypothetical protein AAFH68_28320 [Flavobacterium sp. CGRL1]
MLQKKKPVTVKKLVEVSGSSSSVVKTLVKNEILEEYLLQQDRVLFTGEKSEKELLLSEAQQKCFYSNKTKSY